MIIETIDIYREQESIENSLGEIISTINVSQKTNVNVNFICYSDNEFNELLGFLKQYKNGSNFEFTNPSNPDTKIMDIEGKNHKDVKEVKEPEVVAESNVDSSISCLKI